MLVAGRRKLKTMIGDVNRTVRSTFFSLNTSLPVLVPLTPRMKKTHAADNPASQAELGHGDNGPRPEIDPPSSRAGEEQPSPRPSEASDVIKSSEENPLLGLLEMLDELIDGDTLAELVAIVTEPDEAAALLAIGTMHGHIERRMLGEGMAEEAAATFALQAAERARDAWRALHRPKGHP